MIRHQIFSIARAACQPNDSDNCTSVIELLEDIVNISSRSLKSHILLANRSLEVHTDRKRLESALRADMDRLDHNIRRVNELCQAIDCDDLGSMEAEEFAELFMVEIIASRKQMC